MPAVLTNSANEIAFTLAAAVATSGTFTATYPGGVSGLFNAAGVGYGKGDYTFNNGQHKLVLGQNVYSSPKDFTLTFNANASGITVTNKGAATWPAGMSGILQLNPSGAPVLPQGTTTARIGGSGIVKLNELGLDLGSPNAGTATGVCLSQAVAAPKNLTLNGALAQVINGVTVAVLDVPRTLQFVSANAGDTTQTVNISGYDEYGSKVSETVTLNGTTIVTSKKALVAVTNMAISAATAGNVSVGASNTLGLPLAVWKAGQILKELQDGALATAGTTVAADQSTQTATTGDVRGTYIPNSTPNGTLGFFLVVTLPDPSDIGVPQFASF